MIFSHITFIALILSYTLVVWFKTDAVAEYAALLHLDVLFRFSEYRQLKESGYEGNYVEFLHEYYKDFFIVRLVSCPVCLSFWMGTAVALARHELFYFTVCPLTLFFYLLFNKLF